MSRAPSAPRFVRGLSLIELMVALAIGSVLVLGLVEVFAASRTAYQLSEGMARTQENARFAMDYLQRDIRMAGHFGCVNDQSHLQTNGALTSHFAAATSDTNGINFPLSIRGYNANGTNPAQTVTLGALAAGWAPALPNAIQNLFPTPVPGSDIIELRYFASEGVPVSGITNTGTSTTITVPAARWPSLTRDGVAAPQMFGVADCSHADVFPASAVATGSVTFNAVVTRYTPQPAGQTMLYRADSLVYYIGLNAQQQPALYRARSGNGGTYVAEELVEGIENMQFLFGLDRQVNLVANPPSGYIDVIQPASAVVNTPEQWRRVGAVQVGILARSPNIAAAQRENTGGDIDTDRRKRLLGTVFNPPAANDRLYRGAYETTIALRNRLYSN